MAETPIGFLPDYSLINYTPVEEHRTEVVTSLNGREQRRPLFPPTGYRKWTGTTVGLSKSKTMELARFFSARRGALTPFWAVAPDRERFTDLSIGTTSATGRNLTLPYSEAELSRVTIGGVEIDPSLYKVVPNQGSNPISTSPYGASYIDGLKIDGKYLYVSFITGNRLNIYDISDSQVPVFVGGITFGSSPRGMAIKYPYVYIATYSDSKVYVIDCSNPASPSNVANVTVATNPNDVIIYGNTLYVCSVAGGLIQSIDITNPLVPGTPVSSVTVNNVYGIDITYPYIYTPAFNAALFRIVDVSQTPPYPIVGSCSFASCMNVKKLSGNRVVACSYTANKGTSRIAIINVANPASPAILGSLYNIPTYAFEIQVKDDYVFIGHGGSIDQSESITVYDCKGNTPVWINTLYGNVVNNSAGQYGAITGLALNDNYLYGQVYHMTHLQTFDISDLKKAHALGKNDRLYFPATFGVAADLKITGTGRPCIKAKATDVSTRTWRNANGELIAGFDYEISQVF